MTQFAAVAPSANSELDYAVFIYQPCFYNDQSSDEVYPPVAFVKDSVLTAFKNTFLSSSLKTVAIG